MINRLDWIFLGRVYAIFFLDLLIAEVFACWSVGLTFCWILCLFSVLQLRVWKDKGRRFKLTKGEVFKTAMQRSRNTADENRSKNNALNFACFMYSVVSV